MIALLVAAVLVAVAVAVTRNERRRRALDSATVELSMDADGVTRILGDGRREHVRWAGLREVEVLVRSDGPVLVLTGTGEDGCLAPVALAAEEGIVARLHELPGFDGAGFLRGLEAPLTTRTSCWSTVHG